MPTYEYKCEQGHTFEVMQRMTDDPVSSCQTCSAPVQRVFHPVAVHFKGSGFYNTDYGTRKRAREKGEGGEGASTDGAGKKDSNVSKSEGPSKSESSSKPESSSTGKSGSSSTSTKSSPSSD